MGRNLTFGGKIAAGFGLVVVFTIVIGVIALLALQTVVESKDRVITIDAPLMVRAAQMQTIRQQLTSSFRNFLLSNDPADLESRETARTNFLASLDALKADATSETGAGLVAAIQTEFAGHKVAVDEVIALRRVGSGIPEVLRAYDEKVVPVGTTLSAAITEYVTHRQGALDAARQASTDAAWLAQIIILSVAAAAVAIAAAVAFYLARALNRQISTAVNQVQSSAAELQTAANQQATGVKEQVSSMSEINITISELLATSRQIAESAQRVAQISEQTTSAARSGDGTVDLANDSITGIRRQVDLVVGHMLELGKKSQQIGAVLDIVTELAEQTNILSINATIEAAGAGENGKRFAVVADEIRKLADRVAGSAKEIRTLIDDVRGSVNITVMATETGSKAVDSGSRQFGDVATVFK